MVTPDSPLVGPPSGTLNAALDYAGTENAEYIREVWRLATLVGIDPAVLIAQSAHETMDWVSFWWREKLNPAGIGITGDFNQNWASQTWANQTDAARGHVAHMIAYTYRSLFDQGGGNVWTGDNGATETYLGTRPLWIEDTRFYHAVRAIGGEAKTIRDLTGKWATDPLYHDGIIRKHRAIFGAGGTETMGRLLTIDYSPLPCPVIIDLIPETQPNQNPGIELGKPTSGTWHETANTAPGANALMHQRYLNNGADGSQISWHFTVDDTRIVQHMPLDRVAWHAGDGAGPGNMSSIAVECCVNSDGNLRRAQEHQAALFGLLRAKGVLGDVWQHNHWSGKNCPTQLRAGVGGFDWADAQTLIRSYAGEYGKATTPPTAPQPASIWWEPGDIGPQQRESDGAWALAMLGEVTAKRKVPVRVSADSGSTVIETLEIGDKRKLVGTGKYRNRWNFIEVSPGVYGRALWSAFHERFPTL